MRLSNKNNKINIKEKIIDTEQVLSKEFFVLTLI